MIWTLFGIVALACWFLGFCFTIRLVGWNRRNKGSSECADKAASRPGSRPPWLDNRTSTINFIIGDGSVPPAVTRFPPWNRGSPALRERGFSLSGSIGP
jgi:hypothetical protein